jgi:uncharacterized protein
VSELWLALAIVMVLEGIGPMLFPKRWRLMLLNILQMPAQQLRTYGGVLVTIGVISIWYLQQ